VRWTTIVIAALAATAARAQDDEPGRTELFLLDASDALGVAEEPVWEKVTEGDVLVVKVDPTRMYRFDNRPDGAACRAQDEAAVALAAAAQAKADSAKAREAARKEKEAAAKEKTAAAGEEQAAAAAKGAAAKDREAALQAGDKPKAEAAAAKEAAAAEKEAAAAKRRTEAAAREAAATGKEQAAAEKEAEATKNEAAAAQKDTSRKACFVAQLPAPDDKPTLPRDLRHFYFVAPLARYVLAPGGCTAPKPRDETMIACEETPLSPRNTWRLDENWRLYRCPPVAERAFADLRVPAPSPNPWSIRVLGMDDKYECARSYDDVLFAPDAVSGVTVTVSRAGFPPVPIAAELQQGVWVANVPMSLPGVTELEVRVLRRGRPDPLVKSVPRFHVRRRVTHSQVRIQAELLATNRARNIALAAAVTPVAKRFFTEGPMSRCFFGCTLVPTFLLRLSGDNTNVLQLGFGGAVFFTRSLSVNGGVLLGTRDASTWWDPQRNWFVGIALDPILLAEARSAR
jgi:hypothetical protein